jgi:putative FmdB family regulatory protein
MPIYAYRCSACGHAKDVLQKLSDPVLSTCPACGADAFTKQVTAAGFQLKGSGWYATDFKGGPAAPAADKGEAGGEAKPDAKADGKPDSKTDSKPDSKADTKPDSKPDTKPASTSAAAPPAAPAPSAGH